MMQYGGSAKCFLWFFVWMMHVTNSMRFKDNFFVKTMHADLFSRIAWQKAKLNEKHLSYESSVYFVQSLRPWSMSITMVTEFDLSSVGTKQ